MADLPDYLTDQTYEAILQRLLSRVPNDIDKGEGSFIWDALAPVAAELAQQRDYFRYYVEQAFATHAEGKFLDYLAADYGLSRRPAVPAVVLLEFKGIYGTVIPQRTAVSTADGQIIFETDAEAVVGEDGTAIISATCTKAGSVGNVAANTLTHLVSVVSGITSVTNPQPAVGGLDEESDESLRQRILYLRRNPERGGALSDYERWALSVSGVTWAKAVDKPRGLGTVDVVIAGDITRLDELVAQVQAVVDLKKPCGVDAKVKKVQVVTLTFRLAVTGLDVETAKAAALGYLNSVGIGETVVLAKLVAAVINRGAQDVVVLEPAENVVLPSDAKLDPVVYIE